MDSILSHPLVVLVAGAIITGLLIPWFTRQWQDRQKELELKTKLVSDISESTMTVLKCIEAVRVLRTWLPKQKSENNAGVNDDRARNQYLEAFDAMNDAAQKFAVKSAVIGTNLQAYLPQTEIPDKWSDFSDVVLSFYALEGTHGVQKKKQYTDELRQKLSVLVSAETIVGDDWLEIRDRIFEVKVELIQNILTSKISVFGRPSFLRICLKKPLNGRPGRPPLDYAQDRQLAVGTFPF